MTAAELQKLLDAATPGPWEYNQVTFTSVWGPSDEHIHYTQNGPRASANARLIALAPGLAARVIAMEKVMDAYTELLATVKGECPSLLNEDSGASQVLLDLIADAEVAK